jgi:hypothetical protein
MISLLFSCAASQNLNDYFGIEMDEDEASNFEIVSYESDRGANYYSNSRMNTQLYAWAEIQSSMVKLKVVNTTNLHVPISYNLDQFSVYTEEDEEFLLVKGDRIDYPPNESIGPNKAVEYSLQLPMNFWRSSSISTASEADPNSYEAFWKGENTIQLVKEKIVMIKVRLGGEKTIIMKPVP